MIYKSKLVQKIINNKENKDKKNIIEKFKVIIQDKLGE